jgi:hypothetical protein
VDAALVASIREVEMHGQRDALFHRPIEHTLQQRAHQRIT